MTPPAPAAAPPAAKSPESTNHGPAGGRGLRVLLLQLDGKIPNLALMRIAAHHRERGDEVTLRRAGNERAIEPHLGDAPFDRVYASAIFTRTAPVVERLRVVYPGAIVGGTGVDVSLRVEDVGVTTTALDYSAYPGWRSSIGFTQRGCRLRCGFCVVPKKEGAVAEVATIADIWRGDPWPREVLLLDNDFFGQPRWRDRVDELRAGGFRVSFNQGINARFLDDESAAALASVDYRDDGMRQRRIYTAWDNRKDEARLFAGLDALVRHGVKPAHVMAYMLIGYWPGETHEDREHRRARLRDFGALPYPMPFERTAELLAFQRWVIGGYDKQIPWAEWWGGARGQPRNLTRRGGRSLPLFTEAAQ